MRSPGPWKPAALAACLAACLFAPSCKGGPSSPPEKLVIASAMLPQAALMHLAVAGRYFAAEGLEVTVRPHAFGRLALAAVQAGEADIATVADTPVVMATLRGEQVAVLAVISSATRNNALLARKAAGIASPRDLAGKRVGVPRGTTAEFFLDMTLVRSGVRRGALTVVDLKPDDMEGALRRAEVDAVVAWHPYIGLLVNRLGGALVTLPGEGDYAETFEVTARRDFPQTRAVAAEKVLRALLRAEAFAREQPREARGIAATALGVNPAELEKVWSIYDLRVRLDQSLFTLMDEQARWAIRSGLATRQDTPDFREVIAPGPLLAVKPDAVHLIR